MEDINPFSESGRLLDQHNKYWHMDMCICAMMLAIYIYHKINYPVHNIPYCS